MIRMLQLVAAAGLGVLCMHAPVAALDATAPLEAYDAPVYVSAFQVSPMGQYGSELSAFELYNSSNELVSVDGWQVVAGNADGPICTVELGAYIPPKQHVVAAAPGVFSLDTVREFIDVCHDDERSITTLELHSPQRLQEAVGEFTPGAWVRKNLTKKYRSGNFQKDFEAMDDDSRTSLYAGAWYEPRSVMPLEISEILPRARDCSPLETSFECGDYVKLYNPTNQPISLEGLRLRIGHKTQSPTATNAINLTGELDAGRYGLITTRADGAQLSITDSGGWVWLEDIYGIVVYDDSVVAYESASSQEKTGWSWAYDSTSGAWRWTTTPAPYDGPSVFTMPVVQQGTSQSNTARTLKPCGPGEYRNPATNRCRKIRSPARTLKPCGPGEYRNPITNRCKKIASKNGAKSLKPCGPGEYRNPITNRCKKIGSATRTLKPCGPGEYRNPATNRCKKIASASSSTLKPCKPGYERNPETNRCRKVKGASTDVPAAAFPVEPIADSEATMSAWWAIGGLLLAGAGYAAWEWRYELGRAAKRLVGRK
ncbi:hypothetical protein CR983_01005 [Candidatus Saccharibacteria bacterium]|nr:MAG: hypothetical protein CR983_01005 [Candidatus Saccharibacteria bacterium]